MDAMYVVKYLNELLEIDRDAISNLIASRVECNEKLSNHPTVQVGTREDGKYEVGLLGILNGLFSVDENEYGEIYMVVEDDKKTPVKFLTRDEYKRSE
ncbi:MAG: hypothetical protein Q7J73_00660 [Dehalococcoidales bacterium]|nr:hypothetical protein [Dehalococcoidales bacterium]